MYTGGSLSLAGYQLCLNQQVSDSLRDHVSKDKVWADEITQWVKVLAAKSDKMTSNNQV